MEFISLLKSKSTKVIDYLKRKFTKKFIEVNLKRICSYFLIFFSSLLFWELAFYIIINKGLKGFSLPIILFIIPLSMLLTALSGWFKNDLVNKIITPVILGIVDIFYIAELLYFKSFGSLISISMVGMGGDAMSNFDWALMETIKSSVGYILLFLLPILVYVGIVFFYLRLTNGKHSRKNVTRIDPIVHAIIFVAFIILWLVSVLLLPIGGTADHTAYGAYHSKFVDTDTASSKLGVLTNAIVESKSMLFGEKENEETDFGDETEISVIPTVKKDAAEEAMPKLGTEKLNTTPHELKKLDFEALAEAAKNSELRSLCQYIGSQTGTKRNEMTGLFKGQNLIYICAESFSSAAINETATPTLYKLAHEGIVLNNYYNSFKNTTTNGEFAFLAGIWPDVSRNAKFGTAVGSMAQSANIDMTMSLGHQMASAGAKTHAYHNYVGSYYSRNKSWPNMGFEDCQFAKSGMKFSTYWPASDLELMKQSVDDYINDDQFCTYYMTFSAHGPYSSSNCIYTKNISTVSKLLKNTKLSATAVGYLTVHYELDKALEYLLGRLEEAGKLETTTIVLVGDHYPYYLTLSDYNALLGHKTDSTFEMYKSTCIMWNGGLEKPIETDTYCCNVDILPTILNLYGVQYDSRLVAGNDIFSDGVHAAILYNKNFITDYVKYDNSTGKATYLVDVEEYGEDFLNAHIEEMKKYVLNQYSMSLSIAKTNFYSYIKLRDIVGKK